ncbi:MAG: ribonuclease HI [Phycisphaerales bacterium]|nr:ribonuclease HI [Planctomycetaceae bacterium]MDP6310537.1 ribonuclease HI [Phycisphaerales bacterium]MDP7087414.1 ribonuclease HI [Phycisphaerales bacterium]MDP7188517.1 ribonuclease HI [Phycisphaerales bacterium]MDP7518820.1 ribonuclease HI [Phycisphaerales bacterium]
MTNPSLHVELHSDGACFGNPGPGGWACVIRPVSGPGEEVVLAGGEPETTNNRMELTAVLEGLRSVPDGATVDLWADSKYVLQGLSEWMDNWKRRGWKTSSRKPVKNEDLWRPLDEQRMRLELTFNWVEGHTGHPDNERCDLLAKQQAEMFEQEV